MNEIRKRNALPHQDNNSVWDSDYDLQYHKGNPMKHTYKIRVDDVGNPYEQEISTIIDECSVANWDGYDANPIDQDSIQHVMRFLQKLPSNITPPELAPEPSGDLTMVWSRRGYQLIIGIDATGQIAWGGTSGCGRVYGDAKFENEIPEKTLNVISSFAKEPCIELEKLND